jgi:hypothetical protein
MTWRSAKAAQTLERGPMTRYSVAFRVEGESQRMH